MSEEQSRTDRRGRKRGQLKQMRARNRRIVEEFDGENHTQLAAKWGLSERTIYRIVSGR